MDRQLYEQKLNIFKDIQKDAHHALRIAVCGKFKSGKSSLLNLLLGTQLPVKSVTATGIVTKIAYGNMAAVKMRTGEIKNVSRQELYDYISVADKTLDGVTIGDATCAYVGSRSRLLKRGKVEFWDTPGLEDDPELTKITMDALQVCDLAIYVMHATQVLSHYEKRLFPKLDKLMNGNILFVVNHMDSLRSEEAQSVRQFVGKALSSYKKQSFSGDAIFFTSANPNHPQIESLQNAIRQIVKQKQTRLTIMNSTKIGKAAVVQEEWQEYIAEDMQEAEEGIARYQRLIAEDIARKKEALERAYQSCEEKGKALQNGLDTSVQDERAWRAVLIRYQKLPDWEKDFVNEASARIKGRMTELIQDGNRDIQNLVEGTAFETDKFTIVLNEELVWKKAFWYKNFTWPLFFPEKRFRQYSIDCVEKTISALMANPVPIVKKQISDSFEKFWDALERHYRQAMAAVDGEPELKRGLVEANVDKKKIIEYQMQIAAIHVDIQNAKSRQTLSYKLKDFFASIFPGMLTEELYG